MLLNLTLWAVAVGHIWEMCVILYMLFFTHYAGKVFNPNRYTAETVFGLIRQHAFSKHL